MYFTQQYVVIDIIESFAKIYSKTTNITIYFILFIYKMLSYRRETSTRCVTVLANSGILELGDNILRTL